MQVFISHNRADKVVARVLAFALADQGVGVFFDEWSIAPGESITGGIERGLSSSSVFALIWSEAASASEWVGTELRAYVRRRVDETSLRIVPIMLDDTPLPTLVADYRGFRVGAGVTIEDVADELTGSPSVLTLAGRLQRRMNELVANNTQPDDPFRVLVCPQCGGADFERLHEVDYRNDEGYFLIKCNDCGWGEWTQ